MKIKFYSLIILICVSCMDKSKEITVAPNEFGILIDSEGKLSTRKLLQEGTYSMKDSTLDIVKFSTFNEVKFISTFVTRDSIEYVGFLTIDYILDTTKVFEMYSAYGKGYYQIIYEPSLAKIFRETISTYHSESLKHDKGYRLFMNSLTEEINTNMPNNFIILTELKLDSIAGDYSKNPFN